MEIKVLSSLEKCFLDESIESKRTIDRVSMLKNEVLSLQIAVYQPENSPHYTKNHLIAESALDTLKLYRIEHVPSIMPDYPGRNSPTVLRNEPGLFPDLLTPLTSDDLFYIRATQLTSFWVEIDGADLTGEQTVVFKLVSDKGELVAETSVVVDIIDALLPEQSVNYAQWFHCDCLAVYYNVEVFSERHWEIIESYLKTALKYGVNIILTPIITPPLDTEVGGERPTVQLVDVYKNDGEYSFGYSRLDRWVEMCERCGVKYYEMAHLFTQWGVEFAPKVMATVDGEYKRIFGWDVSARDDEYVRFLKAFLHELVLHLKELGIDKRCFWHISDEPRGRHVQNYLDARAVVKSELGDYKIIDAISDYDFYETGALDIPIPVIQRMQPFLDHGVQNLWTYYCSRPSIALKTCCNRIYGAKFFKYKIEGFLEWGYNFWFDENSHHPVDPYRDTTGDFFIPSGDNFVVYPAPDGSAYKSSRIITIYEAFQDHSAMVLCEKYYGRDYVMGLIDEYLGEDMAFEEYPTDYATFDLRERINLAIKAKVSN